MNPTHLRTQQNPEETHTVKVAGPKKLPKYPRCLLLELQLALLDLHSYGTKCK